MLKKSLLFIGFFALAILIYRDGLHIPYYLDDYEHLFTDPQPEISHSFFQANSYAHFYRPIERSVLAFIQTYHGWDTFPIRLLHLLLHSCGAFLVFHVLRKWKVSFATSVFGAIFMLVSQLSVYAVASNDTQSQIEGALFSAISLWLFYQYLESKEGNTWKFILSIVCFFLALLSKETSAGLFLSIAFIAVSIQSNANMLLHRCKKAIPVLTPFVFCGVVYLLIRINAGGAFPVVGEGSYSFHLGFNIIKNIGLFLIQEFIPVSSISVMRDVFYKNYFHLALLFLFSIIFALFFLYGLWRSQRRKIILGLFALIFFSWMPPFFLASISELYPYNSIIYIAVLFGISAEYYFTLNLSLRLRLTVTVIFMTALFTNEFAVFSKVSSMKAMGDRAAAFLPQIISYAKNLPQNSVMYLVNPKDTAFKYAEFEMNGFKVISGCDHLVKYHSGRNDFEYFIADSTDCATGAKEHPGVAYSYDQTTLRIYPIEPNFAAPLPK